MSNFQLRTELYCLIIMLCSTEKQYVGFDFLVYHENLVVISEILHLQFLYLFLNAFSLYIPYLLDQKPRRLLVY